MTQSYLPPNHRMKDKALSKHQYSIAMFTLYLPIGCVGLFYSIHPLLVGSLLVWYRARRTRNIYSQWDRLIHSSCLHSSLPLISSLRTGKHMPSIRANGCLKWESCPQMLPRLFVGSLQGSYVPSCNKIGTLTFTTC